MADWLVTAVALVVLVNPFFFSYAGSAYAKWNNLIGGALVLLLAIYQDLHDERPVHRGA